MKSIVDFFDFALLLVMLGLMLPFLFSEIKPLVNMLNYGFETPEDKTMKPYEGDVLISSDVSLEDSLTAAEIVLMTKVVNRETVKPSRYSLPDGMVITVDHEYSAYMNSYTAAVQRILNKGLRYGMYYDYTAAIWRLTER